MFAMQTTGVPDEAWLQTSKAINQTESPCTPIERVLCDLEGYLRNLWKVLLRLSEESFTGLLMEASVNTRWEQDDWLQ